MDQNNCRDVPPIIERIDDPQQVLAQIVECLEYQDSRGLKTYVLEHKLKHEPIMWELVLKIGEKVTAQMSEQNQEFFNVCNRCLVYLMKVGNPKEMLLAVLEQMDTFIDDIKYICFLPLVQLTLLKIPTKLFHSLDIALETVSAHLRSLPIPDNVTLEGEERRLFHIDKAVVRITDILDNFLDFLEPFVKSVTSDQVDFADGKKNEALVLKKHLIKIFDFPLLHMVLTHDPSKPKSNGRLCVEKAMVMLSSLETDFNRFLTNAKSRRLDKDTANTEEEKEEESTEEENLDSEQHDNDENERRVQEADQRKAEKAKLNDFVENWDFRLEVTEQAQACLAYILQSEFLGLDKYPQTFTREYLLEQHLDSVSILLKSSVYPVNEKGLLLCKSLVDPVLPSSLPSYCLDNPGYRTVLNDLIHVLIKCPVKDHRTLALPVFTTMINIFEDAGRFLIYKSLLSSCSHSGVKGYIITLLKDDINHSIKTLNAIQGGESKTHQASSKYFVGSRLNTILSLAAALPEKETSDMLENSDQIISVFNLIRFIVIADPFNKNLSGFWNYLPSLEKDFLNPLRKGLDLSEAHYDLERQNVMQGKASTFGGGGSGGGKMEMDVSVGGASLPVMEKEEKLQLISKALNTHQLMKSLLSRLSELIDKISTPRLLLCPRCLAPRAASVTSVTVGGRRFYSSDKAKNGAGDDKIHGEHPSVSDKFPESELGYDPKTEEEEDEYEHGIKQRVLVASLNHVLELGWSKEALQAGARDEGLSEAVHGMFPRGGAEVVSHFYKKCNTDLVEHMKAEVGKLAEEGNEKPKTRPFLQDAVETRLKMIIPYHSIWKEAMAIQTLPQNALESWQNLLNLCDDMWFYAGDRSTSFDWYTKRYSLAACYKATEIYMLQDTSPDFQDTWIFLDNRLNDLQSLGEARRSLGPMMDGINGLMEMGRNVLGMNSRKR